MYSYLGDDLDVSETEFEGHNKTLFVDPMATKTK